MNPFTPAFIVFGVLALIGFVIILLDDYLRPRWKR